MSILRCDLCSAPATSVGVVFGPDRRPVRFANECGRCQHSYYWVDLDRIFADVEGWRRHFGQKITGWLSSFERWLAYYGIGS